VSTRGDLIVRNSLKLTFAKFLRSAQYIHYLQLINLKNMSLPQPDLPEPAHPEIDSMLSRKFGKEIANYFSGTEFRLVS
jgi:hypothetical protein